MSDPTQSDLLHSVEAHLRLHGAAFARADLQAFVASCWPLIEDDPDPGLWAARFAERCHAGPAATH